MKLVNLVIVSCLAFLACGDGGTETQNEFVPSTGLVETMAKAQCDRVFKCCDEDELKIVLGGMDAIDKDECVRNLKKQLSAFFGPGIEAAQTKNRVKIDASKIDSCGDAIRTQSCENISDDGTQIQRFEACRIAVIAEQESAGFCDNNYECKSQFCVSEDTGGSCKTIPAVEEPCESLLCGKDQFCDENEICRALGKDGDACLNNASCESGQCNIESNMCETPPELCNE